MSITTPSVGGRPGSDPLPNLYTGWSIVGCVSNVTPLPVAELRHTACWTLGLTARRAVLRGTGVSAHNDSAGLTSQRAQCGRRSARTPLCADIDASPANSGQEGGSMMSLLCAPLLAALRRLRPTATMSAVAGNGLVL